jgi:hypothetical protein
LPLGAIVVELDIRVCDETDQIVAVFDDSFLQGGGRTFGDRHQSLEETPWGQMPPGRRHSPELPSTPDSLITLLSLVRDVNAGSQQYLNSAIRASC